MYKNSETFVVYVAALEVLEPAVHLFWALLLTTLQQDKVPTKIVPEYTDYSDVFSLDLAMELPENTGINEYTIELIDGKQSPYRPIYSLEPIELETLKAYIETHLKTGLFDPLNLLQMHPSFLIRSSIEVYGYLLITEGLII